MSKSFFVAIAATYLCVSCWSTNPNENNPMVEPLDKRADSYSQVQPPKAISQTKSIMLLKIVNKIDKDVKDGAYEEVRHKGQGTISDVMTYAGGNGPVLSVFTEASGNSFMFYKLEGTYTAITRDNHIFLMRADELVYVEVEGESVMVTFDHKQAAGSMLTTSQNFLELIEE